MIDGWYIDNFVKAYICAVYHSHVIRKKCLPKFKEINAMLVPSRASTIPYDFTNQ